MRSIRSYSLEKNVNIRIRIIQTSNVWQTSVPKTMTVIRQKAALVSCTVRFGPAAQRLEN
jgi:hypothetical protein